MFFVKAVEFLLKFDFVSSLWTTDLHQDAKRKWKKIQLHVTLVRITLFN